MSAMDGRRLIGEVLGEMVAPGESDLDEVEAVGESLLRGNVTRLYGL